MSLSSLIKNGLKGFGFSGDEGSSINIVDGKDVSNAVVKIESCVNNFDHFSPFLKNTPKTENSGSGFFISQDEILTNYHVIKNTCSLTIKMKALGTEKLSVDLVGVCPSLDLALLKLTEKSKTKIRAVLPEIPVLSIGSSDSLRRGDKIITLGYPFGVDDLKITAGIFSGTQNIVLLDQELLLTAIQTDAAINFGNSGGPSINENGECVGINFCVSLNAGAQNVGYVLPISYVKEAIQVLKTSKIYRKPNHGIVYAQVISSYLADWIGLESDGGIFVASVLKNSIIEKFGVQAGDAIISLNGLKIDSSGLIQTSWSEDKILALFVAERFLRQEGLKLELIRGGQRLEIEIPRLDAQIIEQTTPKIRFKFPESEEIKAEIFAGAVFCQLSTNHLYAAQTNPGLVMYTALATSLNPGLLSVLKPENQQQGKVVITNVLSSSVAEASRVGIRPSMVLKSINDVKVTELTDLSVEIAKSFARKDEFVILEIEEGLKLPLKLSDVIEDEVRLAALHGYSREFSSILEEILKGS